MGIAYEKWNDNLEYIDKNTIRLEEEEDGGNLRLYHYFNTLRWQQCYAIVYHGFVLMERYGELGEAPYDAWAMAVDMIRVSHLHEESLSTDKDSEECGFDR